MMMTKISLSKTTIEDLDAFLEFDVFVNLVSRTEDELQKLGIGVFFVDEMGAMRIIGSIGV